ncbi:MAG: aldehyde dehydrogenase family protein [Bacteroidota bacterium]
MTLTILEKAKWDNLMIQTRQLVPESFDANGDLLNLIGGEWQNPGNKKLFTSCVDGTILGHYPMIDAMTCKVAVEHSRKEYNAWKDLPLEKRHELVRQTVDDIERHQELLAYLLVWEIGKPYDQALDGVHRCISGVRWYLDNIEGLLGKRTPLGLVSNIASWNYPISVLVHACLVQSLVGNSIIAKTPSAGGLYALTVCFALAKRNGLPFSLVSGSGGVLSDALVRNEHIDCLSYVGGKSNGRSIASSLFDENKRYMLEMEGINSYGVWNFSDWPTLAKQIKSGFKYGKQRCTAYVRFVVQRTLFPAFLDMYLPVLKSLKFGHPLLVEEGMDKPPQLDFGPLINAQKVSDVNVMFNDAIGKGAVAIYKGEIDPERFLPQQDISAYFAPAALLNIPRNANLYHNEPFGPLDTIVLVDTQEELVSEMNVSNGALVSSIACDDPHEAQGIAGQLRGFKVGVNQMKSRGDNEATFGGIGESWKGCFVGGKYLVQAVTGSPLEEKLYGNFPSYTQLPGVRS